MTTKFTMVFPADSTEDKEETGYQTLQDLVLAEIYKSRKNKEPSSSCQYELSQLAGEVAYRLVDLFTYSKMDGKNVTTIPMILTEDRYVTFPNPLYQCGGLENIFNLIMSHADTQSDNYINTRHGSDTLTQMYDSMMALATELRLINPENPKIMKWTRISEGLEKINKFLQLEIANPKPYDGQEGDFLDMLSNFHKGAEVMLKKGETDLNLSTMNKDDAIVLLAREIASLEQNSATRDILLSWFSSDKNEWLDELFYGWVFSYPLYRVPRFIGFRNYL
jgi:hypothetical protein